MERGKYVEAKFFYKTSETSYRLFLTHDDVICKQRTRKKLKDSLNCKLKRHFETYNGSECLKRICTLCDCAKILRKTRD